MSLEDHFFKPTRPEDRSGGLPGFDPKDSPLRPGGARPLGDDKASPLSESLHGLTDFPTEPHPRRVIYRVRREGWVARRAAARQRFQELVEKGGLSPERRIVDKLRTRNGLLERARENAVRPRFNMRRGTP
ncbi:MAG: hypothetical protein ACAI25_08955 [Planctomycetota bacterium]